MGATEAGTRGYFNRFANSSSSTVLGITEWQASTIGFGGYRLSEHEPDHREALKSALCSGINLIDTSTNYMHGSSERLVGEVLEELFRTHLLQREEVIVVTKVGYLQGPNLKLAKERIRDARPFPDMVEYQNDCWHNISPEFIAEQITSSLERLRLDKIDVLLLHNPEYFLKTQNNLELYYSRIAKAFEHLEKEVQNKRIQYYGISSNSFPVPDNSAEFTSLDRVFKIAKGLRKNHHFAFIQFPFNLYEAGAALTANHDGLSTLEFAKTHKLATLSNRPFNAFYRNRMLRLVSYPQHDEVELKGEIHRVLGKVIELEKRFPIEKLPQTLGWGHILRDKINELDDILSWKEALYHQIIPSISSSLERLDDSQPEKNSWSNEYRHLIPQLLNLMTKNLESLASKKSQSLIATLEKDVPSLSNSPTLSQKGLRIYRSIPGLNVVLAGLRQPSYVLDAQGPFEPLLPEEALQLLKNLQRHR